MILEVYQGDELKFYDRQGKAFTQGKFLRCAFVQMWLECPVSGEEFPVYYSEFRSFRNLDSDDPDYPLNPEDCEFFEDDYLIRP